MNHMVVGLGGTGGRIIRDLRKSVMQDFPDGSGWPRRKTATGAMETVVGMDFLYVDSNLKDLDHNRDYWRFLGRDLGLSKRNKVLISDARIQETIRNIQREPSISPWLGPAELWEPRVRGLEGAPGANQIRRLGRYLFAKNVDSFRNSLKARVQDLTSGGSGEVTFHICCTMACGTGSGCIVDVIAQIRQLYGDPGQYPIFVYGLVTERHHTANTGNFYANQYAVLSELNALKVGAYTPHDVSSAKGGRFADHGSFSACYLLSDENEQGVVIPKEQQEQVIADMIYHRAVVLRNAMPDALHKAFSFEDRLMYTGEPAERPERSYFFGTFGLKRWLVPEEEIRIKLTESLVLQATHQLIYNSWDEGFGFRKRPVNRDLPDEITDPANNERWLLTDKHLTLSIDFRLGDSKNQYAEIPTDWERITNRHVSNLENGTDRRSWLVQLRTKMDEYYKSLFRKVGVVQYYNDRRGAKQDYANEVVSRVESDLLESWEKGDLSLTDLSRILDTLSKHCDKRLENLEASIASYRAKVETAQRAEEDLQSRYNKIGILSTLLGETRRTFGDYSIALKEEMVCATYVEAYGFACQLLRQVQTELQAIAVTVRELLSKAIQVEKEVSEKLSALAQEQGDKSNPMQQTEVDVAAIDAVVQAITTNEQASKALCASIRADLVRQAGSSRTFRDLNHDLNVADLIASMEQKCELEAQAAHARLTQADGGLRKVLGVSIVEKLKTDHGGRVTDQLKNSIEQMMTNAVSCMRIDKSAASARLALQSSVVPEMPARSLVVFIPELSNPKDPFRMGLVEAFAGAMPNGVSVTVVPAPKERQNEILIMSLTFWMAVRFMKPLGMLNKRYAARVAEADSRLEVHSEDQLRLPSLQFGGEEVDLKPYLLLAEALGLLSMQEDPTVGEQKLFLVEMDESGLPVSDPVVMGTDFLSAERSIGPNESRPLRRVVDAKLAEASMHHKTRKDELAGKLKQKVLSIFDDRGKMVMDPVYKEWKAAHDQAIAIMEAASRG